MIQKIKISYRILLLNIFTLFTSALSQNQHLQFEHINIKNGLSQNSVWSIIQDQKGFLWFATEDGLNRFDGTSFRVFKPDPDDQYSISHNFIWCLQEDSCGNIWIGTNGGGLNCYDPTTERFIHYLYTREDTTGINHNHIYCIHQDQSGILWIGTSGGGLNKMVINQENIAVFSHFRHHPRNPGSISNDNIQCIKEDSCGNIWIGTENGLNLLPRDQKNNKNPTFTRFHHHPDDPGSLSHNNITAMDIDRKGILWIGTSGGGVTGMDIRDSVKKPNIVFCYRHDPSHLASLSSDIIKTIVQTPSGTLWIGTDEGLNRFNPDTGSFIPYTHNVMDSQSLSNNLIESMYEDRTGIVWIGTYGGGINKHDPYRKKFKSYSLVSENNPVPGSTDNTIWSISIYQDFSGNRKTVWVGTNGGLITLLLDENNTITSPQISYHHDPGDPESLSQNMVKDIFKDNQGNVWVGTWGGGLNKMDSRTGNFYSYRHNAADLYSLSSDYVKVIFQDSKGDLFIGTRKGLNKLVIDQTTSSVSFIRYTHSADDPHSLSHNSIYDICEDSSHTIWIATWGGGINKFDKHTGTFHHYRHLPSDPQSLSHDLILSVYQDQSGVLWVGTSGGGLNRFDPVTETFHHYLEGDGLPNNVVYSILEDDDHYLWISTNKGLSRFNPRRETFKNYDITDGLRSNEFNGGASFKDTGGMLFFGGLNGLTYFYPDSIRKNPYPPIVVFTDFQQFNQSVPILPEKQGATVLRRSISETEQIQLPYTSNSFCITFAALQFSSPSMNTYAVKLEGFESTWKHIGNRNFSIYTNLAPGTYRFLVKAANRDGVWNKKAVSLLIDIHPPFWKTWWFTSLLILSFSVMIVSMHLWRIRNIARQKEKLEIQVSKRTREINHKKETLNQTNQNLREEIAERKKIEQALRKSEDRYHSFVQQSSEGIYRTELKEPIPITLPELEQIRRFYEYGYLAECNDVMAKMYGFTKSEEILGKPLVEFHGDANDQQNIDSQRAFIRAGYRLENIETREVDKQGNTQYFLNNATGVINNDHLVAVWGTQRNITPLKQVEEKITASLKEKEFLLQEVHHRVKNNMQTISSLLSLQSQHIQNKQVRELFLESRDRIQSMALVHEEIYQSQDFSKINFSHYINNLTENSTAAYGTHHNNMIIKKDLQNISLTIEQAIPCGLIINELLSNILKHAFPPSFKQKKQITITMKKTQENKININIKDNGIGIPKEIDLKKTESLGLKLVTILAENQLEGDLDITNNNGTTCSVSFDMTT